MKIIGMRRFEYVSNKTRKKTDACYLYCTYEVRNTSGLACTSIFCRSDLVPGDLSIGDNVQVFYNRFGSVEQISKV